MHNKILVVDDEKDIRDLLEIYLRNDGYDVIKASGGAEALDIVSKEEKEKAVDNVIKKVSLYMEE